MGNTKSKKIVYSPAGKVRFLKVFKYHIIKYTLENMNNNTNHLTWNILYLEPLITTFKDEFYGYNITVGDTVEIIKNYTGRDCIVKFDDGCYKIFWMEDAPATAPATVTSEFDPSDPVENDAARYWKNID